MTTTNSVAEPQDGCDCVTIIRSIKPAHVGKSYWLDSDGNVRKTSAANVIEGVAESYMTDTAANMADLLTSLADSTDLVACTSLWHGDDGQPFTVVNERRLAALLGLHAGAAELAGIHDIGGQRIAARLKRGLYASTWLHLETDEPEGFREEWRDLTFAERLNKMADVVPGIDTCERIELRGSSARVCAPGEQPGDVTHAYIRITDPEMLAALKAHVQVQAVLRDLSFPSPRYHRATGDVARYAHLTLLDLSVWDIGRLTFCAKPTLSDEMIAAGWTVADAGVRIVNEGAGPLDVSGFELPNGDMRAEYHRITGEALTYSGSGLNLITRSRGLLTLETEVESGGTVRTLAAWLTMMPEDTLRCEAPFRHSESEAALLRRTAPQAGQIFDVGNGTLYVLENAPLTADELDAANTQAVAALREIMPIPETSTVFGPTPVEAMPLRDDATMIERLAQLIRPLRLRPDVLPDRDHTQSGKVSVRQAVTAERVTFAMGAIGFVARLNVYSKRPRVDIQEAAGWYDHSRDEGAAMATIHHACVRFGMTNAREVHNAVMRIAEANPYSPVLAWVASKPWDGVSRFMNLANTLKLRDTTQEPWKLAALRRWLTQCVIAWRNYDKGDAAAVVGFVLSLQGAKGTGKTSWVKSLLPAGEVAEGVELHLDRNPVDAIMAATTKPIAELGELDRTLGRSAVAALKNFFTRAVDTYRAPYALGAVAHPRCTVFAATINPEAFLTDDALARRIWPLKIAACDARHSIDLQQLWAEVATWADAGEQHWLTEAETVLHEQAAGSHELDGPIGDLVGELVRDRERATGQAETSWPITTPSRLLERARIPKNNANYQALREAMGAAGFTYNTDRKGWHIPPELPATLLGLGTAVASPETLTPSASYGRRRRRTQA